MRKGWMLLPMGALAFTLATCAYGQDYGQNPHSLSSPVTGKCDCSRHTAEKPKDREVTPYAGEPADMSPYSKFAEPYFLNYTHPNIYSGAGRDIPEPKDVKEVRIGFFGPIEQNPDSKYGVRMLHGAQLAIEDANAHGGYSGLPYTLMLHNDYDNWQAKAVYGDDRPTDPAIWGSSSNETVKMVYDDQDWAIFGSISSESTHIILRVALRAEVPIINSASTDFTIPETYIPWYFTTIQDDRVQCLTLSRRIFTELGMKRVAILRVNNRYGRFGVPKLRDAARRLGHPIVIEQKFMPGATDFSKQLQVIRSSRADAIVLWADQEQAALILKQMRALGMKQRVFGAHRTLGAELLAKAGDTAEGFEAVYPYDPSRNDPKWLDFEKRYEDRFHEKPEHFSALAYDAMSALTQAICKAGLNRAKIHDALVETTEFDGVTGHMVFDPNQKNVSSMFLGTVHNGAIAYRRASMEKEPAEEKKPASAEKSAAPYARVGEEGVEYHGPHTADAPQGVVNVVLFGPKAAQIAAQSEMQSMLQTSTGRAYQLLPVDSQQNWGAASTQLVSALMDQHAVAIIALDRDADHLSMQLALKSFVPVLALNGDKSLTSTNVPWIFKMPSTATPQSALKLLQAAVARGGANGEGIRNVLASGDTLEGVAFLSTGEVKP